MVEQLFKVQPAKVQAVLARLHPRDRGARRKRGRRWKLEEEISRASIDHQSIASILLPYTKKTDFRVAKATGDRDHARFHEPGQKS